MMRFVRWSCIVVACLVIGFGQMAVAWAGSSHILTAHDMFGATSQAEFKDVTVAGQPFTQALVLGTRTSEISTNMQSFRAYNALTFDLGARDDTSTGTTGSVVVYGDDTLLGSYVVTPHRPVRHIVVRLGAHTIIRLVRQSSDNSGYYILANAALVQQGLPVPPPPAITLQGPTSTIGAQQAVDVATQRGAQITIMVVFAMGQHLVDGPHRAGPTGHYLHVFTVPAGSTGRAQVVAVVTDFGVAQTTFVVE